MNISVYQQLARDVFSLPLLYRKIKEKESVFWEVTVSVIVGKKPYEHVGPQDKNA